MLTPTYWFLDAVVPERKHLGLTISTSSCFRGNGIGKDSRSCVSMSIGHRGTLWFEHALPPLKHTFKLGSQGNSTERLWTFKR